MLKWLRELFGGKDTASVHPPPELVKPPQTIEVAPEPVKIEPKTIVSEGEPWHKFPTSPPEPEKPKRTRAKPKQDGAKSTTKSPRVKKNANV
jgi:hypothetical protein